MGYRMIAELRDERATYTRHFDEFDPSSAHAPSAPIAAGLSFRQFSSAANLIGIFTLMSTG
jgi:hypothetical protein